MSRSEPKERKGRRRAVWKILAAAVAGVALCILAVAYHEVGRHQDKLWLHRCNSMEKLKEKESGYPNIEVDLVFREDRTFDVTHDADTTFGLRLDEYFAHLSPGAGKMWLDIKNLNPGNADDMLDALNALTDRYGMDRKRLIVESPDWESLGKFTGEGYYTSCYVTFDLPRRLERGERDSCIAVLRKVADSGKVRALSFPGPWYATLKDRLDRPIDLLTWRHRTTQLELFLTPQGWEMVRDPQLKVILVKDKGRYHR